MQDDTNAPQDGLNKISRRYLLRNSTVAATGAALFPSFITGCSKDTDTPQGSGSLGDPLTPLTPDQLKAAADNLNRMRALLANVYQTAFDYDQIVFDALESTIENGSWKNFIVDILIDIAYVAVATAADATGPEGFALATVYGAFDANG